MSTLQKEYVQDHFVAKLDDPSIFWEFELANNKVVLVRIISYMLKADREPLILNAQNKSGASYEIPWHAIQTIKRHKEGVNG